MTGGGALSILGIELRRSPLRWWLPGLVLIDLAALFARGRWWVGVWPQASAAAQLPAQFLGPVIAAGAAWAAARVSRTATAEQHAAAARPLWQGESLQLASTVLYGLVAYLLGAAAAAGVSFRDAGPGFLWPGYLLLGAAVVAACAAVGHAVGRSFASAYAAPVLCGLACFLVIGTAGDPRALGLSLLDGYPDVALATGAVAARVGLALALLAAAAALPTVLRRRSPGWPLGAARRLGAGVVAGAVLVIAVAVYAGEPVTEARAAPAAPVCSSGTPRICLWPDDRKYLPAVTTLVDRIRPLTGYGMTLPAAFYERGLRATARSSNDFRIIEGSMWSVSPSLAGAVLQATLPTFCTAAGQEADERRTQAYFELETWLEARANAAAQPSDVHGGPPGVDVAAVARVAASPKGVQAPWVAQRLSTIRTTPCG